MKFPTNDAVADAIGAELELADRVSRAKTNAVMAVTVAAMMHAQANTKQFDLATGAADISATASAYVDASVEEFDPVQALIAQSIGTTAAVAEAEVHAMDAGARVKLFERYLQDAIQPIAAAIIKAQS